MSSSGASSSMSVFGWLFAWRFIMGIGACRRSVGVTKVLIHSGFYRNRRGLCE
jgi:hypothetical protein